MKKVFAVWIAAILLLTACAAPAPQEEPEAGDQAGPVKTDAGNWPEPVEIIPDEAGEAEEEPVQEVPRAAGPALQAAEPASLAAEPEEEPVAAESDRAESATVAQAEEGLYQFKVTLEGEEYQLPTPYSLFASNGWSIPQIEECSLGAGQYLTGQTMTREGLQVTVSLVNLTDSAQKGADCMVGGLRVQSGGEKAASLELYGGVTLGTAWEDVAALYGEPTSRYAALQSENCLYSLQSYEYVELQVDTQSNLVDMIDVERFEDYERPAQDGGDESAPQSVLLYEPPQTLDEGGLCVEYAGDLYRLPAPVSQFIQNGWVLARLDGERLSPGATPARCCARETRCCAPTFTTTPMGRLPHRTAGSLW